MYEHPAQHNITIFFQKRVFTKKRQAEPITKKEADSLLKIMDDIKNLQDRQEEFTSSEHTLVTNFNIISTTLTSIKDSLEKLDIDVGKS